MRTAAPQQHAEAEARQSRARPSSRSSAVIDDRRTQAVTQRRLQALADNHAKPLQRAVSLDDEMGNAVKFGAEMAQTGTTDEVAHIFNLDTTPTQGLYVTDNPGSECAAVWTATAGKVTKLVLPQLSGADKDVNLTHGITREQQCRALALHELVHVKQGLQNQANNPDARLGSSAARFGPSEIVATLRTTLGMIPAPVDAAPSPYSTPEKKSNALRLHMIARLQYLTDECIRTIQSERGRGVDAGLILQRFNLEAPTVIAELTRTVGDAIAAQPPMAVLDQWQAVAEYLTQLSIDAG